uniref:Acetylglutamate kinase n=1 Tax=Haraldiophyllum bonnemaisonii TaxID=167977 RepID=A0A4D6WXC4_9FLOR|nr:acetylglutamate kinase [Haraldiophyllum bonnemaisonii]
MLNNLDLEKFSFLSSQDILDFKNKYFGSIFVIKYGGAAMKNDNLKYKVIQDLVFLHSLGIHLILVHGGGPFINDWLLKLNIKPQFNDGIRVTDHTTMEVVEMVLSGKINKELVGLLSTFNVSAIGLSGKDSNLITASPLFNSLNNYVGKIESINNKILNLLLQSNYIPVLASIGLDSSNNTYNINADTVASSIAISMNAKKLVLLTDISGIMLDINDNSTLLKQLNLSTVNQLKANNTIYGGMIPKVDCCINALLSNIDSTHIIDGRVEHALLYEMLTPARLGSMIVLD